MFTDQDGGGAASKIPPSNPEQSRRLTFSDINSFPERAHPEGGLVGRDGVHCVDPVANFEERGKVLVR